VLASSERRWSSRTRAPWRARGLRRLAVREHASLAQVLACGLGARQDRLQPIDLFGPVADVDVGVHLILIGLVAGGARRGCVLFGRREA
jgi:hypothetical protein